MAFKAEQTAADAHQSYTQDGSLDKPGERQNDNATQASRTLVEQALDSSGDRSQAAKNIDTVLKSQDDSQLVKDGLLPNISLAYIQDDGNVTSQGKIVTKGKADGTGTSDKPRNNFANLSQLDQNGEGISLRDLEIARKNESGRIDAVDSRIAAEILNNDRLRSEYFSPGDKSKMLGDTGVTLDGDYTREELTKILQFEKARVGNTESKTTAAAPENVPLTQEQLNKLNQETDYKPVGSKTTKVGTSWQSWESRDTGNNEDGLISRTEFDRHKKDYGLENVSFDQLARYQKGNDKYIQYDRNTGRLVWDSQDPEINQLNSPVEMKVSPTRQNPNGIEKYSSQWNLMERKVNTNSAPDGLISKSEFESIKEIVAAKANSQGADEKVKQLNALLQKINFDETAITGPENKPYIQYDLKTGKLQMPLPANNARTT
jgi:hypothetical protein